MEQSSTGLYPLLLLLLALWGGTHRLMTEVKGSPETVLANFPLYGKGMALCKSCTVSNLLILLFADHSFLGFEWQKRWCALSKTVFYYYGSDKGNAGIYSHQFPLHEFVTVFLHSEQKTKVEKTLRCFCRT